MTDVLRAEYSLLTAVPTAFSPAGETAERSDGAPVQLLMPVVKVVRRAYSCTSNVW